MIPTTSHLLRASCYSLLSRIEAKRGNYLVYWVWETDICVSRDVSFFQCLQILKSNQEITYPALRATGRAACLWNVVPCDGIYTRCRMINVHSHHCWHRHPAETLRFTLRIREGVTCNVNAGGWRIPLLQFQRHSTLHRGPWAMCRVKH